MNVRAWIRRGLYVCLASLAITAVGACSAFAASPWWHFTSSVRPSTLKPGGEGVIGFRALNIGDAATAFENAGGEPTPVTITATLPAGVTVTPVSEVDPTPNVTLHTFPETELGTSRCSEPSPGQVSCAYEPPLTPFEYVEMSVAVKAEAGTGGSARAEVSGGGAPAVSLTRSVSVSEAPVPFGVEDQGFTIVPEQEGGALETQAGSHPFQLTTYFALNQTADTIHPPALPKSLKFTLPSGLVANAATFPRCSEAAFLTKGLGVGEADLCPQESAVGVVALTLYQTAFVGEAPTQTYPVPVFNLTPKRGEPARFGFYFAGVAVPIDFSIRTGSDYGATATVSNITQISNFISQSLTLWGVPGQATHDAARGWGCVARGFYQFQEKPSCNPSSDNHPAPFLTLPTACTGAFGASVEGVSWPTKAAPAGVPLAPASYSLQDGFGRPASLANCGHLSFGPFIEAAPDVQTASSSTGLTVNVRVPQEANENALGPASSSIKDITVALPEGVTINPSGAGGLDACSEGLVGYLPSSSSPPTELHFTPRLPGSIAALEASESAPLQPGVNFCSTASKVGTVDITSPLLPATQHLTGGVYLATQNENPFGSLIAMYIVAEDPVSGVLVKLAGSVHLGEDGQIVTTFANNPPLPFEVASLHFFGGDRGALATPTRCGQYTSLATFTPWSGGPSVNSSSSFQINSGPGPSGSPCPGASLPFSPTLTGGGTNVNAGTFTPLTTTINREDGEQTLQSVQIHLPSGLAGLLPGVKLCPNSQADAGTCQPDSLIGETTVSAGVGSTPVTIAGGKVYLTENYAGSPFGLSIVSPVKAGPFDLERDTSNPNQQPSCDCIVVRARIDVNPHTAALTVTTDPSGPHAIPRLIDGVPAYIRKVNVTINREHFAFNPTNCNNLSLTGSLTGSEGAVASSLSAPFAVTNCAKLEFAPKFSVATSGRVSKANGTSLSVKLAYPAAPFGTSANIAKVKVSLPKQLPSRLTTLNKACASAVFDANPAKCPKESIVGHARVITPVLPVPLEGNAYFVSHAAEAFPDLTLVLHGYGVTVDLVGSTQIKNGITTTTFKTTPDVPFNTFELSLPQGKFSALTANTNLCTSKLTMPTEFTAQSGAVIKQSTPISVTGCSTRLSIVSHSVKRRTLTLHVFVPAAGKVSVRGSGLVMATAHARAREVLRLVVKAHRAGKFKAHVKLAFAPAKGRRQAKSLPVQFKN